MNFELPEVLDFELGVSSQFETDSRVLIYCEIKDYKHGWIFPICRSQTR